MNFIIRLHTPNKLSNNTREIDWNSLYVLSQIDILALNPHFKYTSTKRNIPTQLIFGDVLTPFIQLYLLT